MLPPLPLLIRRTPSVHAWACAGVAVEQQRVVLAPVFACELFGLACTCDRSGVLVRPLCLCTSLSSGCTCVSTFSYFVSVSMPLAWVSMHLFHRTLFSLYYTILHIRHAGVAWEPLYMFCDQRISQPPSSCAPHGFLFYFSWPSPRDGASAGFSCCVLRLWKRLWMRFSALVVWPPPSPIPRPTPNGIATSCLRPLHLFLLPLFQPIMGNGVCVSAWATEALHCCCSCLPPHGC